MKLIKMVFLVIVIVIAFGADLLFKGRIYQTLQKLLQK
ncbi:hypothetical protein DFP99_0660 [Weissella soli]|uniref:Uncharacterized protein n=1 Tax=Weissella soli TaxID=155866 RepID=A0A288QBN4_9LACO|nr:hypothetical protein WSWS_01031 [Weissella soli]RDL12225.1 hypothetical protein DFP99_0660 [Weissella soli]